MLELITLFGISIVGTLVWVISAEVSAAVYASQLDHNAILVGVVCALGQGVTFTVLYWFGETISERWRGLQRQLDRIQKRFGDRLLGAFTPISFLGGFIGIPPAVGMAALAAGLGVSYRASVPFIVLGRFFRFSAIGFGADWLLPYLI